MANEAGNEVDKKHPGVPLTLEGREMVGRVRAMVAPLVEAERKQLEDDEINGWGGTSDAEWLLVGAAAEMVDMAKSNAQDKLAADLYTAVAMGLAVGSDNSRVVAHVLYEFGGGRDRFMDLLDVTAESGGGSRANTPRPMFRRLFVRTLVERRRFESVERFEHDRQFQDDERERLTAGLPVYRWLKKMLELGVNLGGLYREVFADEEGSGKLLNVDAFLARLRTAEDIESIARQRMGLDEGVKVVEEERFDS